MGAAIEITGIGVCDYFVTHALGLRWYSYEHFKEVSDLRRATAVIGHLPIHVLLLLAVDAAKGGWQRRRWIWIHRFEPQGVGQQCLN